MEPYILFGIWYGRAYSYSTIDRKHPSQISKKPKCADRFVTQPVRRHDKNKWSGAKLCQTNIPTGIQSSIYSLLQKIIPHYYEYKLPIPTAYAIGPHLGCSTDSYCGTIGFLYVSKRRYTPIFPIDSQ